MAAKNKDGKKEIVITAGDKDLRFAVGIADFTRYQNAFQMDDKVAPSDNFAVMAAHPDDKVDVIELCEQGFAVELAGMLAAEFKPEIELKVKK